MPNKTAKTVAKATGAKTTASKVAAKAPVKTPVKAAPPKPVAVAPKAPAKPVADKPGVSCPIPDRADRPTRWAARPRRHQPYVPGDGTRLRRRVGSEYV